MHIVAMDAVLPANSEIKEKRKEDTARVKRAKKTTERPKIAVGKA